mmetsp:Transcript_13197/g.28401  ORF Transcript_13197/g.28401 Transcript_13197/m.28401 type:complete len:438 (-) Transcript_13197:101-1414(-)
MHSLGLRRVGEIRPVVRPNNLVVEGETGAVETVVLNGKHVQRHATLAGFEVDLLLVATGIEAVIHCLPPDDITDLEPLVQRQVHILVSGPGEPGFDAKRLFVGNLDGEVPVLSHTDLGSLDLVVLVFLGIEHVLADELGVIGTGISKFVEDVLAPAAGVLHGVVGGVALLRNFLRLFLLLRLVLRLVLGVIFGPCGVVRCRICGTLGSAGEMGRLNLLLGLVKRLQVHALLFHVLVLMSRVFGLGVFLFLLLLTFHLLLGTLLPGLLAGVFVLLILFLLILKLVVKALLLLLELIVFFLRAVGRFTRGFARGFASCLDIGHSATLGRPPAKEFVCQRKLVWRFHVLSGRLGIHDVKIIAEDLLRGQLGRPLHGLILNILLVAQVEAILFLGFAHPLFLSVHLTFLLLPCLEPFLCSLVGDVNVAVVQIVGFGQLGNV